MARTWAVTDRCLIAIQPLLFSSPLIGRRQHLSFPLTRRHVADVTGLSQMHLARVLKEMRDKRLALIDRAALIVYDWERLAEIAEYIPVGTVGRRAIL